MAPPPADHDHIEEDIDGIPMMVQPVVPSEAKSAPAVAAPPQMGSGFPDAGELVPPPVPPVVPPPEALPPEVPPPTVPPPVVPLPEVPPQYAVPIPLPGDRPDRSRTAVVLGAVLGVLVVGLAIALALALVRVGDLQSQNSSLASSTAIPLRLTSAVGAARTYAGEIGGYDYRHLDKDFGAVLSHSTPSFKTSFTQSSNALKSSLEKYKATAVAKVVSAGVVSASGNRVVVLVLIDQTVNNDIQKHASTDRTQIEMTLLGSGSGWLIDQVILL